MRKFYKYIVGDTVLLLIKPSRHTIGLLCIINRCFSTIHSNVILLLLILIAIVGRLRTYLNAEAQDFVVRCLPTIRWTRTDAGY